MIDIEKMLREGKSLDEIGAAVSEEMNAAQKKLEAEAAAEKAKAKEEEAKAQARKVAVDALSTYFTLVLPKHLITEDINFPELVEEALNSLEETIKLMENVTIKVNGKPFSIFEL